MAAMRKDNALQSGEGQTRDPVPRLKPVEFEGYSELAYHFSQLTV